MKRTRVVVTGIGLVSPVGCGVESFVHSIKQGKTGIAQAKRIDTRSPGKLCAEVIDYEPDKLFEVNKIRRMGRFSLMALGATKLALFDAGIDRTQYRDEDIGIVLSTHYGPSDTVSAYMEKVIRYQEMSPVLFSQTVMNVPIGYISMEFQIKGPSTFLQGGDGFLFGYEHIRSGDSSFLLLGGVDELTQNIFDSYDALNLITDIDNTTQKEKVIHYLPENGFFLGEGACVLVLEEYEKAYTSGRNIYGEIIGVGYSSDTINEQTIIKKSDQGKGMKLAIERAIESAQIEKKEIRSIFSCDNGSAEVKYAEQNALKQIFCEGLEEKMIITGKRYYGEGFHAANYFNISLALLCLKDNELYLSLQRQNDPAGRTTGKEEADYILCNNIYNNGTNSSIILKRIHADEG